MHPCRLPTKPAAIAIVPSPDGLAAHKKKPRRVTGAELQTWDVHSLNAETELYPTMRMQPSP